MHVVIYVERFALNRATYRCIRRRVGQRLAHLQDGLVRTVVSVAWDQGGTGRRLRCRVVVEVAGQPVVVGERTADDLSSALNHALRAVDGWELGVGDSNPAG